MKKNLISILTMLIVFNGCAGVSDIIEELPNGYVYMSEAPKQKWIMRNPLSVNSDLYIPCQILEYKYNQNHIIAKIKFHYDMNYGTIGFNESKILKEGKIYYYIIDTEKNIRYGAFDKKDYINKIKELGINLKL